MKSAHFAAMLKAKLSSEHAQSVLPHFTIHVVKQQVDRQTMLSEFMHHSSQPNWGPDSCALFAPGALCAPVLLRNIRHLAGLQSCQRFSLVSVWFHVGRHRFGLVSVSFRLVVIASG